MQYHVSVMILYKQPQISSTFRIHIFTWFSYFFVSNNENSNCIHRNLHLCRFVLNPAPVFVSPAVYYLFTDFRSRCWRRLFCSAIEMCDLNSTALWTLRGESVLKQSLLSISRDLLKRVSTWRQIKVILNNCNYQRVHSCEILNTLPILFWDICKMFLFAS